jgi:hypothetical protein
MTTQQWIELIRRDPEFFGIAHGVIAMTLCLLDSYEGDGVGVPAGKIRGYLSEHPPFKQAVENSETVYRKLFNLGDKEDV